MCASFRRRCCFLIVRSMPPNAHVSCSSCCPASHCTKIPSFSRGTYARELGAAVTALGDGASLLDVKQTDITTGSLDDSGSVGGGVVAVRQTVSYMASG